MKCKECRKLIIHDIRGHLVTSISGALHAHIESCKACRKEYQETMWLSEGMKAIEETIESGHLSSRLLYEFVDDPGSLDNNTHEFIQEHLEKCPACKEDLQRIEELIHTPFKESAYDPAKKKPEKSFRSYFLNRRLLPAYSISAVLAALFIVFFVYPGIVLPPSYAVRAISDDLALESGYALHDLPTARITRSEERESFTVPEFSISAPGNPVFRINVDTFEDEDVSYEAVIRTGGGETVWESAVEAELLKNGNLLLLIDKGSFEPGLYHIDVTEVAPGKHRMTISKTSFRFVHR